MKEKILLFILLFSQIIYSQENYDMCQNRLIKEAQEQLNKGIAPNDVVLTNKSQTMAEADQIEEIRGQLKRIEKARALKLKQIADAKEDSIAVANNPTLREIREIARAEKAKEEQLHKESIAQHAKEYYYDGYTPLNTLITRQLNSGILPCDVKVTCYADFYGIQGDASSADEAIMINDKLIALCRGLKTGQSVPKYMLELEEYESKLLSDHFNEEQNVLFDIEESNHLSYQEKIVQIQKLDSLYKLRPLIFSKTINLINRLTRDYKSREMANIPSLLLETKKNDIEERYESQQLSNEDYKGIIKMNWDEEKYFALKTKNSNLSSIIKYQSIWSLYSQKKLSKMPLYNIEEAESYSTFIYNANTKILQVQTSSPDGDDTISIKIDSITKNGNTTTYAGKNNFSKMIFAINKVSKWIEVTNTIDGTLVFEYHKIN